MNCTYHPAVESQGFCSACSRPLCPACSHQIKGRVFCQDCLVSGAEWAAAAKGCQVPAGSPRRAALCALIPGMGAVYNSEYLKALTFFSVFAALMIMGDRVNDIFGLGAFAFLIFTMFEAYRSAEAKNRAMIETGPPAPAAVKDRTSAVWGVALILVGLFFLLRSILPLYLLSRFWPLVFICLGGYLVYRYFKAGKSESGGAF